MLKYLHGQMALTLGDNFNLNENTTNSNQYSVSVSCDSSGNFVASWLDNRSGYYDVYARQFSNEGTPLGDDFRVNDNTTAAYLYHPQVSSDNEGNFLIVWEDHRLGFKGDIFGQPYLNDGTSVGDNNKVNDDKGSANQKMPSIAIDICDNFIIAWVDNRDGPDEIYAQRFSHEGAVLGDNFKVNDETSTYSMYSGPSVAVDDSGNFVITWDDFRNEHWGDIYAQRFSNDGTALGSNFKVNSLTSVVYGATVACKSNGDFIITWGDAPDDALDRLRPGQSNVGNDVAPELLSGNYYSKPDIWAQQYLSDGTALGSNFMVNDDGGYTDQTYPAITVVPNGDFIIAWQDNRNGDWEIYLQPYLSNGTAVGANLKIVDSLSTAYQLETSISSDKRGNFIVTWKDNSNGHYDIWAQRFLSDCTPVGNNFLVNNDSVGSDQSSPCVSADVHGNFIITWTDNHNNNKDVYAQRYLTNGEPFGNNYRISGTGDNEQSLPAVALRYNNIYTTWQDNRTGQTGYDVWANVWEWGHIVGMNNFTISEIKPNPELYQNYPNPFNESTTISYSLNEPGFVTLKIYNVFGKEMKSFVNEFQRAETYTLNIDASDLPGGTYFYKLKVGSKNQVVKKMMLLR